MRASLHSRVSAFGLALALTLAACDVGRDAQGAEFASLDDLRLNQTQVIGTHNSYHVAPDAVALQVMRTFAPREADANDYGLPPLTTQLADWGIRQFELDLYQDPDGGRYAHPSTLRLAADQGTPIPAHDPHQELAQPGIKILHSPDFDFRTSVYSLRSALRELRRWSERNPDHFPLFVLLELKSDSFSPLVRPPKWTEASLDELEREILAEWPRERLLTPDDVRGDATSLRVAIQGVGWPKVSACRGKLVLLLDNEDEVRDSYLRRSPTLAKRLLFASVAPTHPAAGWMKKNDPLRQFEEIRQLVAAGFLVRTRADSGLREARAGDNQTSQRAFASGGQLISTDFPRPDPRWPRYSVQFPGGRTVRQRPKGDSP